MYRSSRSGVRRVADEADTWTPLLTMTADGHEIQVAWPGPLPEPVVQDNRALYEGVLPDVDLLLTARNTGYTHVLVVHTPEAAARLAEKPPAYRFTSHTLSFVLDPVTKVLTGKDSANMEVVVAPTPFLWDSAGTHDETAPDPDLEAGTGTNEDPEQIEPAPSRPEQPATDPPSDDDGGGIEPAAHRAAGTAESALALPALHGPGEGAHAATAGASFSEDVLTITPPATYLQGTAGLTYPLFLDPSTTAIRANWTTVYKKYPSSSFYDGANYNEDTKEARVGYERDTWGTARSFFKMALRNNIKGADVSSATLKVLETHSWSCSKRTMQIWRTDPFGTSTTWNRQPAWKRKITSKSFAYGWKSSSSCPDAFVNFTVTSLAQEAADNGWSSFNIGMVASTSTSAPTTSSSALETDTYSWKMFRAEGGGSPEISITYNRRPNTPSSVTLTPGYCDTSSSPYIKIGKTSELYMSAKGTDPDGTLSKLEFEIGRDNDYTNTKQSYNVSITNGETGSVKVPSPVNGVTYRWRVRAWDSKVSGDWAPSTSTYCRFVYDSDLPDSPGQVVSPQFPGDTGDASTSDVWSTVPFGTGGDFTFKVASTETDIVKFVYSINATTYDAYVCANGKQGSTGGGTVSCTTPVKTATATGVKPPAAGPNTLYVKAVDTAGNVSPNATKHFFYVKPRELPDGPGDLNGDGKADLAHVTAAGNLWIDNVSQDGKWLSSTWGTHDNGTLLRDGATAPHIWNGTDTYALVTHSGDFAPADGVADWVIRTPDNRLFLYPGDGYGAIDVNRRVEIRLPANAPSPSTFSEIKSAGDITGDGQPELFVAGGALGAELWVFSGYSGGTFETATQMTTTSWADRDFVAIADYNADGAADMTFRMASGSIQLRKGKPDPSGAGTELKSLGQSGWSMDGDDVYASGMTLAAYPQLYGTADTTGNGTPDVWATNSAGALLLFEGGAASLGTPTTVRSSGFSTIRQLG
ncbi:DNRLRE domain-containing protein [Streptomyces cinereospinus]|uniref:DNRLRE domain-containing protein n=1 Tax=Streptomyces cinereospinus TaxID=285561 RepID=A0ABV5MXA1_9ACTN